MQIIQVDPSDQDRLRYLSSSEPRRQRLKSKPLKEEMGILDDYGPKTKALNDVDDVEEMLDMVSLHIASLAGLERLCAWFRQ
jgi:hypothetical protein